MSGIMLDPEDVPESACPAPPLYHVESNACDHGWITWNDDNKPVWILCSCENPSEPWPAREPTDGPIDCSCAFCNGSMPRQMRGKRDDCEYRNHHCESCHDIRICTQAACGFGRRIDEIEEHSREEHV